MTILADIEIENILKEASKEIKPELDDMIKRLKSKNDINAVKNIVEEISRRTIAYIQESDTDKRALLMRALVSLENAFACYKGVTALMTTRLTTRIVGIVIMLTIKAAVGVII